MGFSTLQDLMGTVHRQVPVVCWQKGHIFATKEEEKVVCERVASVVNEDLQKRGYEFSRLYIAYVLPFFSARSALTLDLGEPQSTRSTSR